MSDNNPDPQGTSPYGQQNQPQYGRNQPQYGENRPQYGEQSPSPYGQQGQPPYGQQGQSPYGQQGQPPYGQQGQSPYGSAMGHYPGQQGFQGQPAENPGRTLGIVGFILAILIAPVGLVISIVAFVKSRKARMGNGFALAGMIIGVVFTILGAILIAVIASFAADLAGQILEACEGLPTGTPVTVQGQPTQCP